MFAVVSDGCFAVGLRPLSREVNLPLLPTNSWTESHALSALPGTCSREILFWGTGKPDSQSSVGATLGFRSPRLLMCLCRASGSLSYSFLSADPGSEQISEKQYVPP